MSPAFRHRYSKGLCASSRLGAEFVETGAHPRTAIRTVGYQARETVDRRSRGQAGSLRC
jgi:hypothetical protein